MKQVKRKILCNCAITCRWQGRNRDIKRFNWFLSSRQYFKMTAFWYVMLCSLVDMYRHSRHSRRTYRVNLLKCLYLSFQTVTSQYSLPWEPEISYPDYLAWLNKCKLFKGDTEEWSQFSINRNSWNNLSNICFKQKFDQNPHCAMAQNHLTGSWQQLTVIPNVKPWYGCIPYGMVIEIMPEFIQLSSVKKDLTFFTVMVHFDALCTTIKVYFKWISMWLWAFIIQGRWHSISLSVKKVERNFPFWNQPWQQNTLFFILTIFCDI